MRLAIALDHSEYAEIVLEHGLDEAVRRGADEVHLITIAVAGEAEEAAREAVEGLLPDALDAFRYAGRVSVHARSGDAAHVIGTVVHELAPDLLVIGRFHTPSVSDELVNRIGVPMLVVGIDGTVLEPQCPACTRVRRETDGEQMFCAEHVSDRGPNLTTRLPSSTYIPSRMW